MDQSKSCSHQSPEESSFLCEMEFFRIQHPFVMRDVAAKDLHTNVQHEYNDRGKVDRIISQKRKLSRNLSRNFVSNQGAPGSNHRRVILRRVPWSIHVTSEDRSDEGVSEEFASGLEVTWLVG